MDLSDMTTVPFISSGTTYYLQYMEVGVTGSPSGPWLAQASYIVGPGPQYNVLDVDASGRGTVNSLSTDPTLPNSTARVLPRGGGFGALVHDSSAERIAQALERLEEKLAAVIGIIDPRRN